MADLLVAFKSISPTDAAPAGTLDGATAIPAPTTMGAAPGSAEVELDNLFYAGVYRGESILITGDLILDAQDDPSAEFIFQSNSTIKSLAGSPAPEPHTRIILRNGAKASNVWWKVGSSATLGTNSEWYGNILSAASITMETGATSCGRLLAGAFITSGAFVFDTNKVYVPGNTTAPAGCE